MGAPEIVEVGFSRRAATFAVLVLMIAISLLDSVTGLFHLTVLYAIPVMIAAWAFGLTGGILTAAAALSAVALTHSLLHSPTLAADVMTDLLVFTFAAVVVDRLRSELQAIRTLEARRDFELGIARDIQRRMQTVPPSDPRFEIASRLDFAREVGGDYFRFDQADSKLLLFAGDIAGKGMSAALFSVLLDDAFDDALSESARLAQLAAAVNKRMYARMPPEIFVTMVFASFGDRRVSFVNAGHVRPLLFVAASQTVVELAEAGTLPLGIEPSVRTTAAKFAFEAGDMLLVCSDGVTESEALLDDPGLLAKTLLGVAALGPQSVVDRVASLAESGGQTDDVTIICVRRI